LKMIPPPNLKRRARFLKSSLKRKRACKLHRKISRLAGHFGPAAEQNGI
jgi:hypothetical protein